MLAIVALVAVWAKNLLVSSGKVLLDREMDAPVVAEIRDVVAAASASKRMRARSPSSPTTRR